MEDSELDRRVAELAKGLGKSKDDEQTVPSYSSLFNEEDLDFDENGTLLDDLIGGSVDLNDAF